MAGTIKISALPAISAEQLTDIFPVVQGGITSKSTIAQLVTLINSDAVLTGFVPIAGGTMTGPLILNADPVLPLGAATKQYVDTIGSGITVILATAAATTVNLVATQAGAGVGATLTNSGAMVAFAVDGYTAALNDRILVKNQTLSQHNGIYNVTNQGSGVTNWILTRSVDYNSNTEIIPGSLVSVNNGTINGVTSWLETATVVVVDTDPVLFSQFSFSPGTFLLKANNLSDVASVPSSNINLVSVLAINAITNIGNADWGKHVICTGSSPYSVTFTGSHTANQWIRISCQTTSNAIVSVLSAIGGTINGQSTIFLGSGDSITVWDDGTNYWIGEQFLQPVDFSSYLNNNQSIPNITDTVITFNTIPRNIGGFMANTGRFTPLVPGLYDLSWNAIYLAGPTGISTVTRVKLNGTPVSTQHLSTIAFVPTTAAQHSSLAGSIRQYMNGTTDYIEVYAFQNSGASLNIQGDAIPTNTTSFYGHRVSLF